ncbi:MAG: PhzF family phenazine biosynthesis protein [Bacillota bacterium]|nr:PhzF family phenazine biosynthesis protein [Bacillota bacterium]
MKTVRVYVIDAFTHKGCGGNTAGVVLTEESGELSDACMLEIAQEQGFSETAFVRRRSQTSLEVRYFTPTNEVAFCGHATIALYALLFEKKLLSSASPDARFQTYTKSGVVDIVRTAEGGILMEMPMPEIVRNLRDEEIAELGVVMGIGDLKTSHPSMGGILLTPSVVRAGLTDIIMPVDGMQMLDALSPDFKALAALSEKHGVVGVHAFAVQSVQNMERGREEYVIHARNFAPLYGIDEESATGTSNAGLTAYLFRHALVRQGEINVILQGEKMNRTSEIHTAIGANILQVGGFAKIR